MMTALKLRTKNRVILAALIFALSPTISRGAPPVAQKAGDPPTLLGPAPPFVPRRTDYSLETGLMSAKSDLFYLGGIVGRTLGRCILTESQTCQQYADFIFGLGAREEETRGYLLASLRWQYVNFPDRYSTYWRLFAGGSPINSAQEKGWRAVGGAGFGVITYLHDKVDLRLEVRGGVSKEPFAMGLIGMQIKYDRFLEYFAERLRALGRGTVSSALEATGTAIQATGEVVEGVSSQFREDDKSMKKPSPKK